MLTRSDDGVRNYALVVDRTNKLMAQYPSVAAVYDGHPMTESALKTILGHMFRKREDVQRKTDIRRYVCEPKK